MTNLITANDSRFETIDKYKQKLIEATNIKDSPEEMKVLDDMMFHFWQMRWLDAIENQEKAEKYRWHDLRKNPEDLPKTC